MSSLKLIRGIVKDAKHSTFTQATSYGSGQHAQTSVTNTDFVDLWLDVDGRDVPVRALSNMPFLPGHSAIFVMRNGVVIYIRNETADRSHFVRTTMLRGESFILNTSMVLFFAGLIALMPVAGGAPIAHIVIPMLLSPFVAWAWSVWSRRRVRADVAALIWAASRSSSSNDQKRAELESKSRRKTGADG
jgi:hypothetical protein